MDNLDAIFSPRTQILTFFPASEISFERQAVMSPVVIEAVNIDNITVPKRIHIIAIIRPAIVLGERSPYLDESKGH